MNLEKKQVTVVGLGKSGEAAAALLAQKGARVSIVDDQVKALPDTLIPYEMKLQCGAWDDHTLLSADQVVVSPGVPLSRLPLSALADRNIEVMGEMELASRFLTAPIIAITGTNGKSTTATLVAEILKAASMKVFLGGNIGVPLSQAVGPSWDVIVVEVSSFQLETIRTFRPKIAALLNVTEDHLNRHGTLEQYAAIKRRIFENQKADDYAVFNRSDPRSCPKDVCSIPIGFNPPDASLLSASSSPTVFLEAGAIYSNLTGDIRPVIEISALKLSGTSNRENVMAAIAISLLAGASSQAITETLKQFSGLPHRMEVIGEKNGICYINDSKGTNVGAVMKSLEGMTRPVVLIAGGLDKGADFAPLTAWRHKMRGMVLIGRSAETLANCFRDALVIRRADSMKTAVTYATQLAQTGDVVLLSPGCASFDMFRDFEDRGDCFRQAVLEN